MYIENTVTTRIVNFPFYFEKNHATSSLFMGSMTILIQPLSYELVMDIFFFLNIRRMALCVGECLQSVRQSACLPVSKRFVNAGLSFCECHDLT